MDQKDRATRLFTSLVPTGVFRLLKPSRHAIVGGIVEFPVAEPKNEFLSFFYAWRWAIDASR